MPYSLNTNEAKKINLLLSKGYCLVTADQLKKRQASKPKKKMPSLAPISSIQNIQKPPKQRQSLVVYDYTPSPQTFIPPPNPTPPVKKKVIREPPPVAVNSQFAISSKIFDYDDPSLKSGTVTSQTLLKQLSEHPAVNLLGYVEMKTFETSFIEIKEKVHVLKDGYKPEDMISDISKICLRIYETFSNDSQEYNDAVSIETFIKKIYKNELESKKRSMSLIEPARSQSNQPKIASFNSNIGFAVSNQAPPNARRKPIQKAVDNSYNNSNVTLLEKRILGQNIKKLPSEYLQEVCMIVFENLENRDYSFDIDTLHVKKIRELQEYVKSCLEKMGEDDKNIDKYYDDYSNESSFVITSDGER